ncbi:hypothetical protein TEA_010483 [Camellia sinensis var. sinensis]|uniref:non-specific serine/threonine protein kinase n=1 Tax=Camellia sinensis var. sinensis TaxID=542762 RepID=A0A4S4EKZ5_CAMSN|nr:hypothetical protein TEA_010483 [Camellia sinensis var. sinensis]
MEGLKIPFLFSSLFSILVISNAVDTITKTQSITGNNTIVSSGGSFEMGFFRPGKSQNQYLGIWYNKISVKTVVWVANREIPLINSSGVLTIIDPGILVLVNGTGTVIWSVNVTGSTQKPIAQLMDSGNLVLKDANDKSDNFLWQSFDYPCDTHLPGMKLGKNFETGLERHLSSWKSRDDPARGEFTYRCDPQGYPQNILSSGSVDLFRTGPWNGIGFSGRPNLKPNPFYKYGLVYSKEEVYYHYELPSPVVSKYDVSYDGIVRRWIWVDQKQKWDVYQSFPQDNCDTYKLCGPNGNCNIGNSPACGCLSKFVPRNETEWRNGDYSNGCVRSTPLNCSNGDGFLNQDGPDIHIRMASFELGFNSLTSRLQWQEKRDSGSDLGIFNWISSTGHKPDRVSPKNEKEEFTDQIGSTLLDWPKRFHIINGIARGLLYLHQDSRLRIIHRDLKASNILLDIAMNQKISDFGIARSFRGNETKANTNRVVGTYGYISPEYATNGLFSIKSDVFSFGVLVLEIVSGKKNKGFYHSGHRLILLGHVSVLRLEAKILLLNQWSPLPKFSLSLAPKHTQSLDHMRILWHSLYKEGRSLQLIDDVVWESCYLTEVLRSIHVGLLCVQESPEDRPSMSSVVVMLSSEGALPQAKQPGFFTERNVLKAGFKETTIMANEITVTMFNGR